MHIRKQMIQLTFDAPSCVFQPFETEKRQQFTKLKRGFRRILYTPRINIVGD